MLIGLLLFWALAFLTGAPRLSVLDMELSPGAAQILLRDREAASIFAPIFYQALGDKPRSDYITNFDFDGDWRGDNNWDNADKDFSLKAFVYYSVSETSSHIFIHYAIFHPRDYKGGERKGKILSELMREGAKRGGKYDPTGLAEESSLAHENDMEGCLVVVAKQGSDLQRARVAFVETLHHNAFSRYVAGEAPPKGFDTILQEEQRVALYVEPRGHGIEAYTAEENQTAKKTLLIYKFTGKAEEPKEDQQGFVGYDLLPIQSTLWPRARTRREGLNQTYGAFHDYGKLSVRVQRAKGAERTFTVGKIGSAFLGRAGGQNMARPPWGWWDRKNKSQPLGLWFFDPAKTIKRNFALDDSFSTTYVRLPFWAGP